METAEERRRVKEEYMRSLNKQKDNSAQSQQQQPNNGNSSISDSVVDRDKSSAQAKREKMLEERRRNFLSKQNGQNNNSSNSGDNNDSNRREDNSGRSANPVHSNPSHNLFSQQQQQQQQQQSHQTQAANRSNRPHQSEPTQINPKAYAKHGYPSEYTYMMAMGQLDIKRDEPESRSDPWQSRANNDALLVGQQGLQHADAPAVDAKSKLREQQADYGRQLEQQLQEQQLANNNLHRAEIVSSGQSVGILPSYDDKARKREQQAEYGRQLEQQMQEQQQSNNRHRDGHSQAVVPGVGILPSHESDKTKKREQQAEYGRYLEKQMQEQHQSHHPYQRGGQQQVGGVGILPSHDDDKARKREQQTEYGRQLEQQMQEQQQSSHSFGRGNGPGSVAGVGILPSHESDKSKKREQQAEYGRYLEKQMQEQHQSHHPYQRGGQQQVGGVGILPSHDDDKARKREQQTEYGRQLEQQMQEQHSYGGHRGGPPQQSGVGILPSYDDDKVRKKAQQAEYGRFLEQQMQEQQSSHVSHARNRNEAYSAAPVTQMGVIDDSELARKKAKQREYAAALQDQQRVKQGNQPQSRQRQADIPSQSSPVAGSDGWVMGPLGVPVRSTLQVGSRNAQKAYSQQNNNNLSPEKIDTNYKPSYDPYRNTNYNNHDQYNDFSRDNNQFQQADPYFDSGGSYAEQPVIPQIVMPQKQNLYSQKTSITGDADDRVSQAKALQAQQARVLEDQIRQNKERQKAEKMKLEQEEMREMQRLEKERLEMQQAFEREKAEKKAKLEEDNKKELEKQIALKKRMKDEEEKRQKEIEEREEARLRKEQELLQRQQEEEVRREAELEARQRAVENHMQPIPSPVKIKKDNSRLFGSPEKVAVNDTVGRSSRPSSAIRRHSKVPVVNSRPTSSEDVSDRRDSPTTSPKKSIRPQDNRNYLFEQEELPQKPMAESVKLIKTPRRVSEDKEVRQLAEKSAKSQLFDPLSPREVSARRESASRSTINSSNRPRSRQQEIVDTKALTENVLRKNSANRTMHQLEEDVNVDKQSHGYQQETFQMQRPNYFEGLDLLQGKSNVQRPPIPTNNPPVNPPKLPLQQRIPDFGSSIGLDKTLDFESKFVLPDGSVFQPDKSKLDKSRPISAASSIPVDVDSLPNRETSALITDFKDTLQLLEDNDDPSVNRFTGKSSAVNDGSRSPDEDINVERLLRKNNRKLNMLDKINNNVNPSDVHSLLHRLSDIHSRPTTAGTEKRPSSSSTSRDEDRLYRNNSNKNIMNNNNNDNKKDNGYSSRPTSGSSSRISPRIRAPDSAVTGLQRSSSLQRSGESLIAERNKLKAISKATNSNPLNIAATKNINSSRVDRSILERNEMSSAKSKQQYHSTRYAKDYSYDSDGSDAYSDYGL